MYKKLINTLWACLCMFSLLVINSVPLSVKAEEIFNLEKDGFWAPADSVTHSFSINNIWNEECYFDYFKFDGSYIKNTVTGEKYSLSKAKEMKIIENYNVLIKLNDSEYGEDILYDGKLMDLENQKVLLKEDIFMRVDTIVDFNITISFESSSGNDYQDIQYIYVFYPHAYKITPTPIDPSEPDPKDPSKPGGEEPNEPGGKEPGDSNGGGNSFNNGGSQGEGENKTPIKTGDENYYSMTFLCVLMIISLEIMFLTIGRGLKKKYRVFFGMRG